MRPPDFGGSPFLLLNRTYPDPEDEALFIMPRSQARMRSDGYSSVNKWASIVSVRQQKTFTHLQVKIKP
jgi:hypothetical protein